VAVVVTRLVVPAYFHPAVRPGDWAELARHPEQVRLVVLNPASGPGTGCDEAFLQPLERLAEAGIAVAGYVDTGYASCPAEDVLAQIRCYADWYSMTGVLFDRTSALSADLAHYTALAGAARELGMATVAFNHGAHPAEGYAAQADLLGTFEGTLPSYLDSVVPRWVRHWPADRFFHLVYEVPENYFGKVRRLADHRHAGGLFLTDQGGLNPWHRVPGGLLASLVP